MPFCYTKCSSVCVRVFVCCATPLSHVRCLCAFWNTFFLGGVGWWWWGGGARSQLFFPSPHNWLSYPKVLEKLVAAMPLADWHDVLCTPLLVSRLRYSARLSLLDPGCMFQSLYVTAYFRSYEKNHLRPYTNVVFAFSRTAPLFYLLLDPDLNGFVFTLCTPSGTLAHLHVRCVSKTFHPPPSVSLDYFLFCQCCITKGAVKAHHLLVSQCLSCSARSSCH